MTATLRRFAVTTATAATVSALAFTATATAAPALPMSTASAQGASVRLPGATATGTGTATAHNTGGPLDRQSTASASTPGPNVLSVGAVSGTAVAKRGGVSYACAGVVEPGGTISLGGDAARCSAKGPGARGIRIDLAALTGAQMPTGVSGVNLFFNAITAFAAQTGAITSGVGKPINTRVIVCLGVTTDGACTGKQVRIPILITGAPNQSLVNALLNGLKASALGPVGTRIATTLAPTLRLRANVHTTTGGVFKVVGVQAGTNTGSAINLAIATAGPNT